MDRLSKRLRTSSTVGLDTAIFIYHFEEHPTYLPLTTAVLMGIEAGERVGVTSTISLMEIIVRPFSLDKDYIARKYETLLVNFPNLMIIDLDRDVIRQAARLRAEFHIRPPDALQLAACQLGGADLFITNDRHFERLRDKFAVMLLEDFIGGN